MDNKYKENTVFFYDKMIDRNANTVRIYKGEPNETPIEIVRGFYRDDFHVSIANQWATGDSTMVSGLVNRVAGLVKMSGLLK